MKKRILALALAGTTAFSVFGGMNAFAAKSDKWEDWNNATSNSAAYDSYYVESSVLKLNEHGNLSWDALNAIAFTYEAEGTYYVGDWALKKGATTEETDAFEKAVKVAIAAAEDAAKKPPYKNNPESAYNNTSEIYEPVNNALKAAYSITSGTVDLKDTKDAIYDLRDEFKAVDDFFKDPTTTEEVTQDDLDVTAIKDEYDIVSFDAYDAEVLFADIFNAYNLENTTYTTYKYLAAEYKRIMGDIDPADHSDLIDEYEHLHEAVSSLTESDYKVRDWADIEDYLRDAEIEAEDGEWREAVRLLREALDVTPDEGDYKELEATLMSMYADEDGRTYARYIVNGKTYIKNKKGTNALYAASDYAVKGGYTDEWEALFVEPIWYYNPLDAMTSTNASGFAKEELCDGVYGYAYDLYTKAKKENVAQSKLDIANEMLIEALEALDPSSTSTEWALVKLEKTVALAEALVDTDFNTTSVKWKTFQKNLEKAQETLAKSNIGKSEVIKVMEALNDSMMELEGIAKNPSYTLKKEYLAVLKEAKEELKGIEDQNATQYKTLMAAIKDAENLGTWLDVNEADEDEHYVDLPSDYEEAIANLEAAIAGYVHPQGWYQNEEGTWFYGVGTENYTGWLEINGRNYFLKDDGSMAASTWVKTDKGYWYYLNEYGIMLHDGWGKINGSWYYFKNFGAMAEGWVKDGNTWYYLTPGSGKMVTGWNLINGKYYYFDASGAMLANTTTPDGYKVDASVKIDNKSIPFLRR